MSKTFQKGTVNFSVIGPNISLTLQTLSLIAEDGTAIPNFQRDFTSEGRFHVLSSDVTVTDKVVTNLKLQSKHVDALTENIKNRFDPDAVPVIAAFDIFNTSSVPAKHSHIEVLASHFYKHLPPEEKTSCQEKLLAEFQLLKYNLALFKVEMPHSMGGQGTEWCLETFLDSKTYCELMPLVISIAEVPLK